MQVINTVGRRKTAVARIYMKPGNGEMVINGRTLAVYFPTEVLQIIANQPFGVVEAVGKYDLKINVRGGGISGQAEAVRMAIARALCEADIENRPPLKKEGFLTRDSRMVERKKFQFSKR
jgi:small subunit ribosomal protein S9